MKRLIIAAALAATVATPALAASDTFRMDIIYSSANLSTHAGAEAEYEYIREQVTERCQSEHASEFRFFPERVTKICTDRTLARAIQKINHPMLDRVHSERR